MSVENVAIGKKSSLFLPETIFIIAPPELPLSTLREPYIGLGEVKDFFVERVFVV